MLTINKIKLNEINFDDYKDILMNDTIYLEEEIEQMRQEAIIWKQKYHPEENGEIKLGFCYGTPYFYIQSTIGDDK